MRKTILFIVAIVFFAACKQKDKGTEVPLSLTSSQDSISYSLGINLASQLKSEGLNDIDPDIFQKAVVDAFQSDSLLLDSEQAKKVLNNYYQTLRANRLQAYLDQGRKFLKENAERKGVKKLKSGLQYEILIQGNGNKPRATQNVKCHYTGFLLDSTIFDSTIKTGVPSIFPVNSAIPGISEALQKMPTGSKWKLFIPTELAYSDKPNPGQLVKPNMALIYEIELLSIEPN